jgi:hypothetical protein
MMTARLAPMVVTVRVPDPRIAILVTPEKKDLIPVLRPALKLLARIAWREHTPPYPVRENAPTVLKVMREPTTVINLVLAMILLLALSA